MLNYRRVRSINYLIEADQLTGITKSCFLTQLTMDMYVIYCTIKTLAIGVRHQLNHGGTVPFPQGYRTRFFLVPTKNGLTMDNPLGSPWWTDPSFRYQKRSVKLLGALEHGRIIWPIFFPFHIWDVMMTYDDIHPIDERRTHIFQRGRAQPPTRKLLTIIHHH